MTIQLTARAWLQELGKQCAWTVCYPLSCFFFYCFAWPPGKRDYLENFHPGSWHHNTGIPANKSGWLVRLSYNRKVDFCWVQLRCRERWKASQPSSCNRASPIFFKAPGTYTQNFSPLPLLSESSDPLFYINWTFPSSTFSPYKYKKNNRKTIFHRKPNNVKNKYNTADRNYTTPS